MTSELHLLVPGLRGPLPPEARESEVVQARLPALERILARGRQESTSARTLIDHLRVLFGLAEDELPAGALGWLGEGNDPGDAYWLRADPVHLQPDRDQLLLFDATALAVGDDEAADLIDQCNRLLAEDELELFAAAPGRWYLRSAQPARLQTTPASAVAGRHLREHLPRGEDARRWLALATELQMLLHQAPTNVERESSGALTVNGVWFWGAGRLPENVSRDWHRVAADEPVARGLAQVSGVTPSAVPAAAQELPAGGRCLIVLTMLADALAAGDLERWRRELEALERNWFAPLLDRLQGGDWSQLIVHSGGRRLTFDRRDRLRVWRRPRPLRYHLEF